MGDFCFFHNSPWRFHNSHSIVKYAHFYLSTKPLISVRKTLLITF